jgi:ABC-2 type transport system permease protein
MGQRQTRSFKSSSEVLLAMSALGFAGTKRRGGAGGMGGCWSPGPWRMNPPGPMETIRGIDATGLSGEPTPTAADDWFMAGAGREIGATLTAARGLGRESSAAFTGFFAAAFLSGSFAFTGDGRDFRPNRCALPITAFRDTPPNSSAIWLAVKPLSHKVLSWSIRSSVHAILAPITSNKLCIAHKIWGGAFAPCDVAAKPIVDIAMTIHQKSGPDGNPDALFGDSPREMQQPPAGIAIQNVNWIGLRTLYLKEVRRFMKVQLQTVWAPAITTLLFLVIFTVALGRGGNKVLGVPFADFLAPGLIIMGMLQNAFANSSFALLVGKIQGTIVDYLMPPLSNAELLVALVGGAVTRAIMVGFAVWLAMLLWPGVHVTIVQPWAVIWFGILGSSLMAIFGVITSIWAEKFDHAAAITNFVIAPLALLSGTFYSVDKLSPAFQAVSHANPFFYIISGFRYGFLGQSDSPVMTGAIVLLVVNIVFAMFAYYLLKSGWKLKN